MLPKRPKTAGKVLLLPIGQIEPSPYQAREEFDSGEIAQLAQSILQNGLLQPVTVRRLSAGRYQLVAGERRLRACRMAGLDELPAILCEYEDAQTAALGLLENLQRQALNPFEQAKGIRELIALWGCTQEEAARRLGMAQPTLNNKLRLLSLDREEQSLCLALGLTERHARAALRLPRPERKKALEQMAKQEMTARQADEYIERLLARPPRRRSIPMVRDVRIFVNTINRAVRLMVDAGVPASSRRTDGEGYIEYTIRIPTNHPSGTPPASAAAPSTVPTRPDAPASTSAAHPGAAPGDHPAAPTARSAAAPGDAAGLPILQTP